MLEEILKEKSWLEQIAESRLPVAVYGWAMARISCSRF